MKREICAPEVPASQMVLTIITKYQQNIARRGYLVPAMVGGKHLYRKADVMRILNGERKQL